MDPRDSALPQLFKYFQQSGQFHGVNLVLLNAVPVHSLHTVNVSPRTKDFDSTRQSQYTSGIIPFQMVTLMSDLQNEHFAQGIANGRPIQP